MPDDLLFGAARELIGHCVRVYNTDGTYVTGVLYDVDPESSDVALVEIAECPELANANVASVRLLLGHGITGIERETDSVVCVDDLKRILISERDQYPAREKVDGITARSEDVQELTSALQAFLDKHLIPNQLDPTSKESNSITLFGGAATVTYPFDPVADIDCDNEQILRRLSALVMAFHANHIPTTTS